MGCSDLVDEEKNNTNLIYAECFKSLISWSVPINKNKQKYGNCSNASLKKFLTVLECRTLDPLSIIVLVYM